MSAKDLLIRARARSNLPNKKKRKGWIQQANMGVNHDIPAGTFLKKAEEIVRIMLKLTKGDVGHAIRKVVFYINRAGGNPPNAKEVKKALKILQERNKK